MCSTLTSHQTKASMCTGLAGLPELELKVQSYVQFRFLAFSGRVISLTIGEEERVSLQAVAELHNISVEPFKFAMCKFL